RARAGNRGGRPAAGADRVEALLPGDAVVDLLRARLIAAEQRDVELVPAEIAEGVEHRILGPDALHHRPLVVAVGEIALRLVAGEVLEELHRRIAVRRVLEHAGAGNVDVRAPALLVREDDAELPGDAPLVGL